MTTRYSWTTWAPESWRIDCRCRCDCRTTLRTCWSIADCGLRIADWNADPSNPQSTVRNPQLGGERGRGDEGSPHRRHRRPPERGQVDPLQPLDRRPGC